MIVTIDTPTGPWKWTWNEGQDRFESAYPIDEIHAVGVYITRGLIDSGSNIPFLISAQYAELQRTILDLEYTPVRPDLDAQPFYDALEEMDEDEF